MLPFRRQPRPLPPLPAVWLWLAMAAALLMAIAPVVSYTLQALGPVQGMAAGPGRDTAAPAHSPSRHLAEAQAGIALAAPAGAHGTRPPLSRHAQPGTHHGDHPAHPAQHPPAAATHGTHAGAHGHDAAADTPTPGSPASATAPHAEHGAACDYCLIAARALAVIAALLWLLLAPRNAGLRPTGRATRAPARQPWPAHAARGPPLIA